MRTPTFFFQSGCLDLNPRPLDPLLGRQLRSYHAAMTIAEALGVCSGRWSPKTSWAELWAGRSLIVMR